MEKNKLLRWILLGLVGFTLIVGVFLFRKSAHPQPSLLISASDMKSPEEVGRILAERFIFDIQSLDSVFFVYSQQQVMTRLWTSFLQKLIELGVDLNKKNIRLISEETDLKNTTDQNSSLKKIMVIRENKLFQSEEEIKKLRSQCQLDEAMIRRECRPLSFFINGKKKYIKPGKAQFGMERYSDMDFELYLTKENF